MMHYKKGKNNEEDLIRENIPIENLPENFLWMHVKGGTKVSNVVDFAKKAFANNEYRSVVWSGSGGGVGKTITCAEIMKNDLVFHQVTRMSYRKVEEFWDAQQDGLEQIVATRNIPCIHIWLSLDEIDSNTPGYQYSKKLTSFWIEPTKQQSKGDYLSAARKSNKSNNNKKRGVDGGDKNGSQSHRNVNAQASGSGGRSSFKKSNNKKPNTTP